jgi:hypothetical protein
MIQGVEAAESYSTKGEDLLSSLMVGSTKTKSPERRT